MKEPLFGQDQLALAGVPQGIELTVKMDAGYPPPSGERRGVMQGSGVRNTHVRAGIIGGRPGATKGSRAGKSGARFMQTSGE